MEILGRRQRERMAFNKRERGGHSTKNDVVLLIYIIKKQPGLNWVYPGRLGSGSTLQVDRVLLGQILGWFFL